MNSNNQKPLTQNEKSPQFSFFSKAQNNLNLNSTQNQAVSPINTVSVLKTEEQKQIVRTNYYGTDGSSPDKNEQFCVVTEIIRRKSNLPFDSKKNTLNQNDVRFSFNQPISNFSFNQSIQNKNINKKKSSDEYKNLIKRIASQLNTKIRPPSQGFFFFAMQKGQYPLMIIKKIENKILNHNIELNSDIFEIYYQKYLKYRELVKKIAFLLKKNLSNKMFWENNKYSQNNQINNNINSNQNIQMKNINNNKILENEIKTNNNANINILLNKSNNTQQMPNKNNLEIKNQNVQVSENRNINNKNIRLNNDKINSYNIINRTNVIFQKSNPIYTASHKLSNVINPFKEAKNQNISRINLTKRNPFIIKNNPFINLNNTNIQNLNNNKNEIKDDIEMKDETRINFNSIEETYINNNIMNIKNNNI